jgi:hypothetical protein
VVSDRDLEMSGGQVDTVHLNPKFGQNGARGGGGYIYTTHRTTVPPLSPKGV